MTNDFSLLLKVSEAMYKTLELDKKIYIILSYATAGCVSSFSRAFLLLVNEEVGMLEGKIGVGPTSQEDANKMWLQINEKNKSLEDFLVEYDKIPDPESMPLYPLVRRLNIPLNREDEIIIQCLKRKKPCRVTKACEPNKVSKEFLNILGTEEFVCIPLIVEDEAIGVLLADNLYSNRPILEEDVKILAFFAHQIVTAIWDARLHRKFFDDQSKLRKMERKLSQFETLISLGEMAANLAHEIKNPLFIIEKFARSICKSIERIQKSDMLKEIKEEAEAIVKEVERLESLLSQRLNFAHLTKPALQLKDLNEIVEEVCNLIEEELREKNIKLLRAFSPLPYLKLDEIQMKQVFFSLIQNAVEVIPQGGKLEIKTQREEDFAKIEVMYTEGTGSKYVREDISKISVIKHIIEQHKGKIEVKNEEDGRARIIIYLPVPEE